MFAQTFLILFVAAQLDVVLGKPLDNSFQANPLLSKSGIPKILAHAAAASEKGKPIDSFPPDAESHQKNRCFLRYTSIPREFYSKVRGGEALYFTGDMDIDCEGVDFECS
jgi:hypothetical protein